MKKFILFLGDAIFLYFSLWLTLMLRYGNSNQWHEHLFPFSIVFIACIIIFYINSLYELDFSKNRSAIFNKIAISLVVAALFAITFFYFGNNRLFTIKPQRVLLVNFIFIFIFLTLWRFFFYRFITSSKLAASLLVVGTNPLAYEIIHKVTEKPQLGFSLKAVMRTNGYKETLPESVFTFSEEEGLKEVCQKFSINTILFSGDLKRDENFLKNLFSCLPFNIVFYELSSFYEKMTGKIPVDYINHTWFLENLQEGSKKLYESIKRILDILFSTILIICAALFIPLIVLAIKIDGPGTVLFKQIRVGKNGKKFLAMKFRTMISEAEKSGPQWAQKNDPRVTRVGTFLRKSRIDEIPQLLNILKGEMSLIGPRPERPEFIEELKKQIPFYEERLLVKPGLTGWAQIMGPSYGGSVKETLEKIQYDLYYIKNRSLGLDLSIILKTIKTILSGRGQ